MAAMKIIRILHSIVALLLIVFYTVIMASLALLLSLFDRTGEYQHWCARTWCRMIAFTVGMRVSIDGIEQLPRHTPAVVLANHQSLLDIPVLFAFLPFQFRILAKRELFRLPFLGWFLWRAGHIPVDRGNRNATPDMIAAARKVLPGSKPSNPVASGWPVRPVCRLSRSPSTGQPPFCRHVPCGWHPARSISPSMRRWMSATFPLKRPWIRWRPR
jgi:1-acyl-sn-glycerol-3-phosphate acyltransferase